MSPVLRIESFPERNGPQIAGVITTYTGMFGVDELLAKLPAEFEVEAANFEGLKSELEQLGCNQEVVLEPELSPEERLLRLFIGSGADYYVRGSGFNVMVFLFGYIWFYYRKLYLMAAGTMLAYILVANIAALLGLSAFLFGLGVSLGLAAFANRWYLWHARRKVRDILQRDLPPEERETLARKAGGTSTLGAVLGVLIMLAAIVLYTMAEQGLLPK